MFRPNYIVIPLITILVAVCGGWLTNSGMGGWYESLAKPDLTPPSVVFGPIWMTIYALATISAVIIWNKAKLSWRYETIIGLFVANALLNVVWSFLFYNQHLVGAALVEMCFLNLTTLALIFLIWPISRVAALLLIPYIVWVSFASYLTYQILNLNVFV